MNNDKPKLNLRSTPSEQDVSRTSLYGTTHSLYNQRTPHIEKKSSSLPAAGSVLRERGKRPETTDIVDVWGDPSFSQLAERSVKSSASGTMQGVVDSIGGITERSQSRFRGGRQRTRHQQQQKARSSHSVLPALRSGAQYIVAWYVRFKRQWGVKGLAVAGLIVVCTIAGVSVLRNGTVTDRSTENVLGAHAGTGTVDTQSAKEQVQLPSVGNDTEFSLFFPASKDAQSFSVVEVSPPGNEPVYAYIDSFAGAELRVSQQQVPQSFQGNVAAKLKETAENFQATDIIQVDGATVYHGFAETYGGVQSLVFIKDDVMIFISSAKKISDDAWAGYVAGLGRT